MNEKEYAKLVKELAPKSPIVKDCIFAFLIGGLICTIGQAFMNLYSYFGLDETNAGTATSMTLVGLSALLTGLSLYDNIAKYAGAGTLVPITGFANAIAAPRHRIQNRRTCPRHRRKDVHHRRPSHRLRRKCQCNIWFNLLDYNVVLRSKQHLWI